MLVAKIILGVTFALGLASFLMIALQCSLSSPWIFIEKHCAGKEERWKAVAAFDIFTELIVFSGLVYIICDVQLRWNKKFTIISGFTFRLL